MRDKLIEKLTTKHPDPHPTHHLTVIACHHAQTLI